MHIHERGQGPVVVLLHGSPTAVDYFDPLVEDLAEDHRVLVPAFPGYRPSPLGASYSVASVQRELEDDLLARGVQEASVVGFSAGAYRGLWLALRSERIRVTHLVTQGGFANLAPDHSRGLASFAGPLRADGVTDAFRQQVASLMLSAPFAQAHPEAVVAVGRWLEAISPPDLATELESWLEADDLRPELGELRAQLTARIGEADLATPPAYTEELVAGVPGSVLERVPGAGHALLIEDRAATIASVRAAIQR